MPAQQSRTTFGLPFGAMTVSWPKFKTDALEALDMRATSVALAVSTTLADRMRDRIVEQGQQRDGSTSPRHIITGGMWAGYEARLAKTGVVKVWFARGSLSAWWGWPKAKLLTKKQRGRIANKDKAGSAQATVREVLLDPAESETESVLAALADWIARDLDETTAPADSPVPALSAALARSLRYV